MNCFFLQDAAAQGGGGSMMPMLIMLVVMFAIMYFFMIRPQKQQQKKIQEWRSSLEIGSDVVLAGGIHGKVKDLNPEQSFIFVEIAKGVSVKVDRNSVFQSMDQTMQK